MTAKQKDQAFKILKAAGGGAAASMIRNGLEKLNYFNGNDDAINAVISGAGVAAVLMGSDDLNPLGYGMIGAVISDLTDEPMQGISRIIPSNGLSRIVPAQGIEEGNYYTPSDVEEMEEMEDYTIYD